MSPSPDVSVVLLCYQEGERIRPVIATLAEQLRAAQINFELILVGNYQPNRPDATPQILQLLATGQPYYHVVAKPKLSQQGLGWDIQQGLAAARGHVLAIVEGDAQVPLHTIVTLYQQLQHDQVDMMQVVREFRHDGWWRRFVSYSYNQLVRWVWPALTTPDINGKPKMFTRAVYNRLRLTSSDWFIDTEIMIQIQQQKLTVGYLPVISQPNQARSSYVTGATVLEFIKNVIRYRYQEWRSGDNDRHTAETKTSRE